jgi:hypothetical protein
MPQPKSSNTDRRLLYYQSATAALAAGLLLLGLVGYLGEGYDPFLTGMAVRIGATLAVVALAMPQLYQLKNRLPGVVGGIALFALVIIATRPNIGKVLLTLLVIAVTVFGVLSWLSKMTGSKKK